VSSATAPCFNASFEFAYALCSSAPSTPTVPGERFSRQFWEVRTCGGFRDDDRRVAAAAPGRHRHRAQLGFVREADSSRRPPARTGERSRDRQSAPLGRTGSSGVQPVQSRELQISPRVMEQTSRPTGTPQRGHGLCWRIPRPSVAAQLGFRGRVLNVAGTHGSAVNSTAPPSSSRILRCEIDLACSVSTEPGV
jgi:hypothetical protein